MHPVRRRPVPHHQGHQDKYIDPLRDKGTDPRHGAGPARSRLPWRALLVLPATVFLLAAVGIEPGWGRFMACVGLLVLGILVVVTWSDRPSLGRLLLQTVYVGGFVAYVLTLFS